MIAALIENLTLDTIADQIVFNLPLSDNPGDYLIFLFFSLTVNAKQRMPPEIPRFSLGKI